jgi:hypothetical protein
MTDTDFYRAPITEKQAVYWIPPTRFDFETGGRALSFEEQKILRRMNKEEARRVVSFNVE